MLKTREATARPSAARSRAVPAMGPPAAASHPSTCCDVDIIGLSGAADTEGADRATVSTAAAAARPRVCKGAIAEWKLLPSPAVLHNKAWLGRPFFVGMCNESFVGRPS